MQGQYSLKKILNLGTLRFLPVFDEKSPADASTIPAAGGLILTRFVKLHRTDMAHWQY